MAEWAGNLGDRQLVDDGMCIGCGPDNIQGLQMTFTLDEQERLHSDVTFSKAHQGFADVVHGGMLALVLDETMVNLTYRVGRPAVSGRLNVRLHRPCPIERQVHITAWVDQDRERSLVTRAQATLNEDLVAEASAVCVRTEWSPTAIQDATGH